MVAKKANTKKKDVMAIPIPIPIPIEWYIPEGLMTPMAFNMTVQFMGDIFKISFFEIKPPIQVDESTPPPSKVRADCVASVFIMPDKLPKFIDVLQQQYDKYLLIKETK